MAKFDQAFDRLSVLEGGYSNHPDDRGGETYAGVSRRYNPDWEGWAVVDAMRGLSGWPGVLDGQLSLRNAVREFYRRTYWVPLLCDAVLPQALAEEIFEQAVNLGRVRAARHLQRALNVALRGPDLVVDGCVGPRTLEAVSQASPRADVVLRVMNVLQGYHYVELMEENPDQEAFARGWLLRAT